jgi:hypothetical protein
VLEIDPLRHENPGAGFNNFEILKQARVYYLSHYFIGKVGD